jgi:chemotaxis protein CheD
MAQSCEEDLVPNLYFDRNFNLEAAKILPGEYYVTGRDMVLVTVLGSCVAACIRDPEKKIGGMNHFMLPESNADPHNPYSASARYGTYAMEILINQLIKLGAKKSNLEAKVFGGGKVMKAMNMTNVGERNAEFVLEYLRVENIRVVAQDLLDVFPRKVYYFSDSGRALIRKLRSVNNDTIAVREREYSSRLEKSSVEGDVDLF